MEKVRAKFKLASVTEFDGEVKQIKMSAVYSTSGENADFTRATPSGEFSIFIAPETKASTFFETGKSYYLDISEAPQG